MSDGGSSKESTLGEYSFYACAGEGFRREILAAADEVVVPGGVVVLEPGKPCRNVALIGSGGVRVFVAGDSGREVTLYHVGRGQTCPVSLLSGLLERNTPASAVTVGETQAVMIPVKQFRSWLEREPVVRAFVLDALAVRFVEVMEQVQEITFGRLDRRLVDLLQKRFNGSGVILATHEQIALELSTAREVVSRLLREFELQGAIDLGRGKVTLRDRRMLDQLRG